MQVKVGKSHNSDVTLAVKEATGGVSSPVGIFFQSSFDQLDSVSEQLSQQFPGVPLIGTGATSYIESEASDKILVVVAFMSGAVVETGVLRYLSTTPLYDIIELENAVSKIRPGQMDTVCLEYCTNDEERLVTSMNVALEKANVPILGGTVFGAPKGQNSRVCVNGKIYEDACAWMLVKNTSGKIRTYSENIYAVPEGAKVHVATKVDLEKKILVSLDGRPAADVYSNEMNVGRGQIVSNVFKSPLGRVVGDDTFIISPYDISPNGGIISYKKVYENDAICFLELLDYRQINENTRNKIKSENPKISFVFSVNCIYRHLFFTNENYIKTFLTDMSRLGNHVGVVGGGEQYKKQHVNQTMVCAVFE